MNDPKKTAETDTKPKAGGADACREEAINSLRTGENPPEIQKVVDEGYIPDIPAEW